MRMGILISELGRESRLKRELASCGFSATIFFEPEQEYNKATESTSSMEQNEMDGLFMDCKIETFSGYLQSEIAHGLFAICSINNNYLLNAGSLIV